MNVAKEYAQVSDVVEQVMREDPRARNDDKWLTYKVMRRYTNIYIPYEDFQKIPSFETISRCRRKIQNTQLKHSPERETAINRWVRQEYIKEWAVER